jgi:hypothetical protein
MTDILPTSTLVKPNIDPHTGTQFTRSHLGFRVVTHREGDEISVQWLKSVKGKMTLERERFFHLPEMMETLTAMARFTGFKGGIVNDIPEGQKTW